VFCHGTPWSSSLWAPFAEALSNDFTVYLWDMPGYGLSSKDPGHAVDLGTQGSLFAALLSEWGLDEPHLVAHDVGGAVALRAHLLHDRGFASLFLLDVVVLRPWGSPFFTLVKQHANVFAQLPPAIHRGAVRAYVEGASHKGLSEDDLDRLTDPWTTEDGRPAFYRQIAEADEKHTDEVTPHLSRVKPAVRIVWGEEDLWIPPTQAIALRDAMPGSSLRVVQRAGHLVHLDAPAALADELRAWLDARIRSVDTDGRARS
jgi:pimeloyl-ACP methyl ester carboxylesterase